MKKVGILGCGWLGLSLGKHLVDQGYHVRGSTRKKEKLHQFHKEGIAPFLIDIQATKISGDFDFFKDLDVLILSIPPGRKTSEKINLADKIRQCCPIIAKSAIPRTIFLSSISVYGNQSGNLNEESPVQPETSAAKHLVRSEKIIERCSSNTSIVRLGGLIGSDRHPIKQLSGREIGNPSGYINFIHQHDAVGILVKLIQDPSLIGVYNGVSPSHPQRKEYYLEMAMRRGLPPPKFIEQGTLKKRINGDKIERDSDFKYQIKKLLI